MADEKKKAGLMVFMKGERLVALIKKGATHSPATEGERSNKRLQLLYCYRIIQKKKKNDTR